MNEQSHMAEALVREIARYLAAVDLFRAERCEPEWLPELVTTAATRVIPAIGSQADARTFRALDS